MHVTPKQIKMARTLLDWSQADLAEKSDVSRHSIIGLESEKSSLNQSNYLKIVQALERSGVEFTEGNGVRERTSILTYKGHKGFIEFMKMVLETSQSPDADICVSGVDESLFGKWTGDFTDTYLETMNALHQENNFDFRILVEEGDDYDTASNYAKYRHLSSGYFVPSPIYVFGHKVAFIEFTKDNVNIWIITSAQLAAAQRKQFNLSWERCK